MFNVILISPKSKSVGGITIWTDLILKKESNDLHFFNINTCVKTTRERKRSIFERTFYSFFKAQKLFKEFKKIVKKNKIDAVHIATSGRLSFYRDYKFIKLANKYNINVCIQFHFGRVPDILEKKKGFEYRYLIKIVKRKVSILCLDNKTLLALSPLHKNTYYCPNPVIIRESIYNFNAKTICFAGFVSKTKGCEKLIQAFIGLKNALDGWTLKIAGTIDPTYKKEFLESIYNQNNIKYCGSLSHEDTMKLIEKSSIFCLPSLSEGMPNSILEAMSLKIPTIASDVGNIKEMLGDTGIVLKENTITDLSFALLGLCNNQNKGEFLSEATFKRCKDNYSLDIVFNKILEVWKNEDINC